ncbi:MAG TPA: histone deacetylase [Polyangiales bacterium]
MPEPVPRSDRIVIVDDSRFDAHEDPTGSHPECPERLVAAREGLYGNLGDAERILLPPREANDVELTRIHRPDYIAALRSQLQASGGHLDPDTYFCRGTREAAWLAAGGAVDLARALVVGPATQGFALLRPPGHHAVPGRSMGFCLLNNVALAAAAALDAGLSRVAIVDWDVHHGNGTQDAFYDDPRVLFISLHQYPYYPGTGAPREIGAGKGMGFTCNLALPAGSGPETYAVAFTDVVLPLLRAYAPEFVLVSAGFDAHARDPLASMQLHSHSYAAMASSLIDLVTSLGHGRIGCVLEGGYDLAALSDSTAAVARALRGERVELPTGKLHPQERAAIDATLHYLKPCWPSVFV